MKIKFNSLVLVGAVCLSASVFAQTGKPALKPVKHPIKYIDPANMDLTVKPGDDFFEGFRRDFIDVAKLVPVHLDCG